MNAVPETNKGSLDHLADKYEIRWIEVHRIAVKHGMY